MIGTFGGFDNAKSHFGLFLLFLAIPALADDQFDQKSVYDAFGELKLKPSTGVTLEQDVTSQIKRHMANLLYPVDLTSFVRPEKDPKLRELIIALQKQMGESRPAAGVKGSSSWPYFDANRTSLARVFA